MSSLSARLRFCTNDDENGKLLEPMELAYIDVPEEFTGTVIDKLSQQKRRAAEHGRCIRRLHPSGVLHSRPAASSATAASS